MAQSVSAVIVAGGKGERMNTDHPKQYLMLGDSPILSHTLLSIDKCPLISSIYLVVPEGDRDFCKTHILETVQLNSRIRLVSGGNSRQESVYNGLSAIKQTDGIVVIHDGVRPFVSPDYIKKCIIVAEIQDACILALPVSDTLKIADTDGTIMHTLERQGMWLAQTPQTFKFELIKKAHDYALLKGFEGTDDASLIEYMGGSVKLIHGSPKNIKITTQDDFSLAKAIFRTNI